jgi:hypothetical protein
VNEEAPRARMTIGREDHDHIIIDVLGRMHPRSDDFWDGNWLMTPLKISVGEFSGEIGATLRADEIRLFRQQLQDIHKSMAGQAQLNSMEGWLTISITIDMSGHLKIEGQAKDRLGSANVLTFRIDGLDQTVLPSLIADLKEVETMFPVVGQPE